MIVMLDYNWCITSMSRQYINASAGPDVPTIGTHDIVGNMYRGYLSWTTSQVSWAHVVHDTLFPTIQSCTHDRYPRWVPTHPRLFPTRHVLESTPPRH